MKPRRTTFEIVVFFLGAALLLSIGGVIALNFFNKPVDDILKQVIIGCLTGIAGILAKDTGKTQDVNVVNQPNDPVPVEAGAPGDAGNGELRLIALFAAASLLALVLYHFLVPHL